MYSALTAEIRVTVRPEFSSERSEPSDDSYFWIYTIEIANHGHKAVKLMHRHWRITDALGHVETVDGPGVVGEQPTIAPGHAYPLFLGLPAENAERLHGRQLRHGRRGRAPFRGRDPRFLARQPVFAQGAELSAIIAPARARRVLTTRLGERPERRRD